MPKTEKQREFRRKYRKTPKGKYEVYKSSAKLRGYDFEIDFELFSSILTQDCHYCGSKSSNGVDRANNDTGYTKENSLPCCKTCNLMKRDLPYNFFLAHIKTINNNLT